MSHDVLIFGASCRAAAFSALRAGLRPRCADYFADRDLAAICHVDRIDPWHPRRDFFALADSLPPTPWFYTGGFENHPSWVEQIARKHLLWGADARALRLVRDPPRVAALLAENGIPVPAVRRDSEGLPRDGSWLVKPLRSGGGRDIRPLSVEWDRSPVPCYFQEWIDGPSFSALYVGERDGSRLVGATKQLLGVGGSRFAYRGSIGPWPIAPSLEPKLRRLGQVLASAFGLLGWFGVDFVLCDQDPWPVEINPRYTASVEIHELAAGRGILCDHRAAFEVGTTSPVTRARVVAPNSRVFAKLILHASRELIAPEIAIDQSAADEPFTLRPIADVPAPGTRFSLNDPVMTLLASADDVAGCQAQLLHLERTWMKRLGFHLE